MISYCRNLEDVIIQRVFADLRAGRFLDIGAGHPIDDSTTYALHERGWRGIAADPVLDAALWQEHRAGDVALRTLVAGQAGTRRLFAYPGYLQSSTGSADTRDHLARIGLDNPTEMEVRAASANDLLAAHAPDHPLHFVSIDVEGMEAEVLAGLDLRRHRPWVMAIEAVLPSQATPSHAAWEPALLARGYRMMYFDGVNRFYLAEERHALAPRFAVPPNVWDSYTRDSDRKAEQRVAELEARIALLSAELIQARSRR